MAIDRRLLFNIDWGFLGAALILMGIGVATILSATFAGRNTGLEVKQLYAVALGLVGMLVVVSLDYRRLVDRAPVLYLAAVGVLVYVLAFGPRIAGTRRWFMGPGGFQVQPSEFAKLVAALLVAKLFAEAKKETLGLFDLLVPGAAVGLMVVLIAAEPDLGTAFTLVPLFLTVAFLAGLRVRAILGVVLVMLVVGSLGWMFALKEYQKSRIYTFLDPNLDPRGAGYQKIQSEIAVGSGGVVGKGYKQGTQSQLGYLPARHTDFIFSVLAEENGFVGVVAVLGLYMFILWRAFETAQMARDRVGAFLAAGIAAILSFQVIYNVAMVAGLVPVKGLPLPLMSYGGSSVLSSLFAVGLILNVRMRRFAN
ncbi:MAG TPA: rod shape-determining protein RodA [Vicinamibacteria bacterium]|nr:rod shape-determining protein RodA [Vicinamibacteria bacterium]